MDLELACRCGKVHGHLRNAAPDRVNRLVCYCDDCQAFAHHVGRADLLDTHGGSDIVQVAPSTLTYDRGDIAAVRLGPKGLYRWYASCCKTPLGNTMTPSLPFVGLMPEVFGAANRDEIFGKPRAELLGKFAIGEPPAASKKVNVRFLARTLRLVLGWKLRRSSQPHPFFDHKGKPKYAVNVLPSAEREGLRPLCGPNPRRA